MGWGEKTKQSNKEKKNNRRTIILGLTTRGEEHRSPEKCLGGGEKGNAKRGGKNTPE